MLKELTQTHLSRLKNISPLDRHLFSLTFENAKISNSMVEAFNLMYSMTGSSVDLRHAKNFSVDSSFDHCSLDFDSYCIGETSIVFNFFLYVIQFLYFKAN